MAINLPRDAGINDYLNTLLNAGIQYTAAKNPAPTYTANAAAQQAQRDVATVSRQPQADPSAPDGSGSGMTEPFLSTTTGKAVAIGGGLTAGLVLLKVLKVI